MHFGADGSFVNAMGGETWVEAQGGAEVAEHQWRPMMGVQLEASITMQTQAS